MRNLLVLLLIGHICYSLSISNCTTISKAGSYELNRNLSGAPFGTEYGVSVLSYYTYCLRINSSDVSLNCNGYSINATDSVKDYFGIVVQGSNNLSDSNSISNISISNCKISGYYVSILLGQANYSTIDNLSSSNEHYGSLIYKSDFIRVSNSLVTKPLKAGFYMFESPGNIEFFNNTVNGGFSPTILGGKKHTFFNYGYFITGENISILNNSAINTSGEGFHMENISNADVAHNFAIDNAEIGFAILIGRNISFEMNRAIGNDTSLDVAHSDNLRISTNTFSDSLFVQNTTNSILSYNMVLNSNGQGIGIYKVKNISFIKNSVLNSSDLGSALGFGDIISISDDVYCYNRYDPYFSFRQLYDFQYSNSSNITIKNITCDHSYPEGLCSNPCPEITTQEPATTPTKIHQGCFSLAILLSICLGVFSSVLKVRA
ncbi:MAG: right-handed parallel beta-helix repeat-containing protein [Candidatus Bilamarchaeum sp.]